MIDLNLSELFEPDKLAIRRDDIADNPDTIRWRAWWDRNYDLTVRGIELKCYPVVRATPKGAWIDPYAYRPGELAEWSFYGPNRWVSNDGAQAWAKPTQAEALNSLVERYRRWAVRISGDIAYFIDASEALKVLMPNRERVAKDGLGQLANILREIKS